MSYWDRRMAQPIWLQKWSTGVEHSDLYSVFMETTHFAIVRMEGHLYWSGLGYRGYAPVSYRIADKNGTVFRNASTLHEGRLNDVARKMLANELEQAERNYVVAVAR